MKRKILLGLSALVFSCLLANSFAEAAVFPVETASELASCPTVHSYTDPTFCTEFQTTVLCNCDARFPHQRDWPIFCASVSEIYHEMIVQYHSIHQACISQYGNNDPVDVLECRNQWHCSMTGVSFSGAICSGNPTPGSACPNNG